MFESSSKTQALDSTSENDMATRFPMFGGNGHWDPMRLQYVFAVFIILPYLFERTFRAWRGIVLVKQQTYLKTVTDLM